MDAELGRSLSHKPLSPLDDGLLDDGAPCTADIPKFSTAIFEFFENGIVMVLILCY